MSLSAPWWSYIVIKSVRYEYKKDKEWKLYKVRIPNIDLYIPSYVLSVSEEGKKTFQEKRVSESLKPYFSIVKAADVRRVEMLFAVIVPDQKQK